LRRRIPSIAYQETLVVTLKETTSILENCSIDAAHPAFRYSILLQGLLNQLAGMEQPRTLLPYALSIDARETRSRFNDDTSSNTAPSKSIPSQDRQRNDPRYTARSFNPPPLSFILGLTYISVTAIRKLMRPMFQVLLH
jgi:hypothetical protein